MMLRLIAVLGFLALQATSALADRAADVTELVDLLKVDETLDIMREEGLRYSGNIAEEMLQGDITDSWKSTVGQIYDTQRMKGVVVDEFGKSLVTTDLEPVLHFFRSAAGREVVELEMAARQAFLEPEVEDAAKLRYERLKQDGAPILEQVETLITDSDLVELNVMGTLNASLMFYRGLNEGGAFEMTESEMLSDVWAQESETREESEIWLNSFLVMAYQPLEAEQLEAYSAFYRTPEGRDLNRAIFAGFDQMYEEVSYLLGLAVAEQMQIEEL